MAEADGADPAPVFRAVDRTVTGALLEILSRGGGRPTGLLGAAFDHALDRVAPRPAPIADLDPGRPRLH